MLTDSFSELSRFAKIDLIGMSLAFLNGIF